MTKMVNLGEFLKIWSLRPNSVTRQVSFNRSKIGRKCQNSKIQMRHFGWFSNTVNLDSFFLTGPEEVTFRRAQHSIHQRICFTRPEQIIASRSQSRIHFPRAKQVLLAGARASWIQVGFTCAPKISTATLRVKSRPTWPEEIRASSIRYLH